MRFWLLAPILALAVGCGGDEPPADATPRGAMKQPNRLVHEKSPYLLQHAYNPVDWYPWGDEAFEKARRENKPVFLSVGYSTCHWCHVMERESFENPDIAAILNEGFVCIKVDREERPDVDQVYMTFVQATTGGGGWPMSVWLTPDAKPFYGGTYFPPQGQGGRPGFADVLQTIRTRWTSHHEQILSSSQEILEQLRARTGLQSSGAATALEPALLDTAYQVQKGRFDATNGGFGGAPKFPRPYELLFLHRIHARKGDPEALAMSVATLGAMADGGIHDQLGGGFHRYATDATWRLPHFEKMLYDQAQLVMAYVEAYQLSGETRFASVAADILSYVRRDLTGAHGGFLSAEDADSAADARHPEEKEEGAFYVWTRAELDSLLGDDAELVARHYGVRAAGNVGGGELAGKNVLYVAEPLAAAAAALGVDPAAAVKRLGAAQATLLAARAARPRPHRDDKVITAWNGLMISAAARAASVLNSAADLEAATRAADFLQRSLWDAEKRHLLRRFRDGEAAVGAFNADYAFLVQGLLDLYEASFDLRWLDWAEQLVERQIELFGDATAGGFFEDSGTDARVLLRTKDDYDGAEPASNSVTTLNLLRLGEMLDNDRYRELAQSTLALYGAAMQRAGAALPAMLLALDFHNSSPRQIIVAGRPGAADTAALLATVYARFLPHTILLLADGGPAQQRLAASIPLLGSISMESGKATAYVCQNYTCKLPVTTATELASLLDTRE